MPSWSVYLVRCRDGALYTGIARDVRRRMAQHGGEDGRGAKYLRGKGPLRLVFTKAVGNKLGLALKVERRIKALSRERKEALLRDDDTIRKVISAAKKHR